MHSLILESHNEQQTQQIGETLAARLRPGMVLALDGELGAGKTRLTRAICDGLGVVDELVNSPTFVIMQTYTSGRLPVYHFDAYRLGDIDEFLEIGAEEFLNDPDAVCLIEWASRVQSVLPVDRISMELRPTGDTSRQIRVCAEGAVSNAVLRELAEQIGQPLS